MNSVKRVASLTIALTALFLLSPRAVLAQGKSTEDIETGPTKAGSQPPPLPWYIPPPGKAFTPPVPPPPPKIDEDIYMTGDLIGLRVEPTFFVGTNATGASPALTTLIHFTTPGIGVDIGYMSVPIPAGNVLASSPATRTSSFVLGVSTLNYGAEVMARGPHHLYVMLPELDARIMLGSSSTGEQTLPNGSPPPDGTSSFQLVAALGGSLTGIRYGLCLGSVSFIAELRGPLAFIYVPTSGGGNSGSGVVDNTNAGKSQPFGATGFAFTAGLGF